MFGIFRKKQKAPSYNDGSLSVNYSTKFVTEDVSVNGQISKIASVKRVDISKLVALPSYNEYDLEIQLKAGVKPQLINVRGILGDDMNVTRDFETLASLVEKPAEKPVEKHAEKPVEKIVEK